ncbi:MAG: hypothetical protein HETSPECPRED_010546 [Heterodermia speciosa]|uniref:Uncharacterized protein n=1 Tax=Heterodermia speciosa TaxID=116794 RepID=A0A8H3G9J7_9LECA|nr:MAG: hypothetical protein HETSPECPRED_010546 [Heterodermia speciosa]
MSDPTEKAAELSDLIQNHEENITHRANRVSKEELRNFPNEDIAAILHQLSPRPKKAGSNNPCGPEINRPSPVVDWMFTFVKAPMPLLWQSVNERAALCVNKLGKFQLRTGGYAVMSHVWGETCGWNTPTSWGPIDAALRKKGIIYSHFIKFFDRCDAEWLWVDILAMPEVFDDMTAAEKAQAETVRTGVINSLNNIYTHADKVVCLDSLLLRLHSGGMIDVAVILCLSRWLTRLWPFAETKLAKRVILKTEDSAFDLDEILSFLYDVVNNDDHRYFPIIARLVPLRPVPPGHRDKTSSPRETEATASQTFHNIYLGCENRNTDIDIDQAKVLFPVLNLKWQTGWTLHQGLRHIADSYPNEKATFQKYCNYRDINFTA